MKRLSIFLLAVSALVLCVIAEQAAVTTTPTSTPAPTQYGKIWSCSVHNTGSNETIYARCNMPVADFVLTNAVPIAPGAAYNFRVGGVGKSPARTIANVVIATQSGTSTANVGFE